MPHIKSYTRIQDRKMAFFLLTSGKIIPKPVFWIHIGFGADPDPAFYLNSLPDPDPGS
jgi:hypothetical protein